MTKKHKYDSDDEHSDSDKPKKKKIKGKKKTKSKKTKSKKPKKIKVLNSSIQTTLPPNPRPIMNNQPMVSGHYDKNDAKDIEKIKENISKGAEVIQTIKEEIKEEKRQRGRPKKTVFKEEKDIIIVPPSGVKTRSQTANLNKSQTANNKSQTVIPFKFASGLKKTKESNKKNKKEYLTYKKIREIVSDDNDLNDLMEEYEIEPIDIVPLLSNKTKLTKYLYQVVNKTKKEEIDLFPHPDNAYEEGLNIFHQKSPNKSSLFGLSPDKLSTIKKDKNNDTTDIFDEKNPFHQELKDNIEEINKISDQLSDHITQLTNTGLNTSSGGTLDDSYSYQEDSNLLSNLLDRDPFSSRIQV